MNRSGGLGLLCLLAGLGACLLCSSSYVHGPSRGGAATFLSPGVDDKVRGSSSLPKKVNKGQDHLNMVPTAHEEGRGTFAAAGTSLSWIGGLTLLGTLVWRSSSRDSRLRVVERLAQWKNNTPKDFRAYPKWTPRMMKEICSDYKPGRNHYCDWVEPACGPAPPEPRPGAELTEKQAASFVFTVNRGDDKFSSPYKLVSKSEEEEDEILAASIAELQEANPMTQQEFADAAMDWRWRWERKFTPYPDTDNVRHIEARHKYLHLLRNEKFYKQMRFLKPLAMRYPTHNKRLWDYDWIYGKTKENCQEKIADSKFYNKSVADAGFDYKEWYQVYTQGTTDTIKEVEEAAEEGEEPKMVAQVVPAAWKQPKVGDRIQGIVVEYEERGVWVDVGAKAWAYIPAKFLSLAPVYDVMQTVSLGDQVYGEVISTTARSCMPGEEGVAFMTVMSLQPTQRLDALEMIKEASGGGLRGDEMKFPVTILEMRVSGAIVQMENGLKGWAAAATLGNLASDNSAIGKKVVMKLKPPMTQNIQNIDIDSMAFIRSMEFSYMGALMQDFEGDAIQAGQVLSGTIDRVRPSALDVKINELDGIVMEIKKGKVTNLDGGSWETMEKFRYGEEVKCIVESANLEQGTYSLAMDFLDAGEEDGSVLDRTKRPILYEAAEEKAEARREALGIIQEAIDRKLEDTLGTGEADLSNLDDSADDF